MSIKRWETYEQVAAFLLDRFAEEFGLGRFEGKQILPGTSGTKWEIDAKGLSEDGTQFLVVECKKHSCTAISQAITASLAWSIQDTGASGGILVSPLGLQAGAKKVAEAANIHEVRLTETSTTTDYVISFLNKLCIGVTDTAHVSMTESLKITGIDEQGNRIDVLSM